MIEISKAFEYEDFTAFDRKRFPKACTSAVMLEVLKIVCESYATDNIEQDRPCMKTLIRALGPPSQSLSGCLAYTDSVPACVGVQTRFVGMMQYDGDLKLPARFLVPPPAIHGVSGKLLADAGVTTFACSETQKFGHVRARGLVPCARLRDV